MRLVKDHYHEIDGGDDDVTPVVPLGASGVIELLKTGADDPSDGAGVTATVGSLYLRTTGQLWQKTGEADTDWTQLLQAP